MSIDDVRLPSNSAKKPAPRAGSSMVCQAGLAPICCCTSSCKRWRCISTSRLRRSRSTDELQSPQFFLFLSYPRTACLLLQQVHP